MNSELFESDPRGYALELVESHLISSKQMLLALLSYMSKDEVREALDANEMSPRFDETEEEEVSK